MKKLTKLTNRANWRNSALLTILALLPACTEAQDLLPPAASGAAPIMDGSNYRIRRATGEGHEWPSLSAVPTTRPPVPTTPAQLQADQAALETDRDNAPLAVEAARNPAPSQSGRAGSIKVPAQAPPPPPELLSE